MVVLDQVDRYFTYLGSLVTLGQLDKEFGYGISIKAFFKS